MSDVSTSDMSLTYVSHTSRVPNPVWAQVPGEVGDMRLTSSEPPYSARYVSHSRRIKSSENSRSSRQFIQRKANLRGSV